MGENLVLKTLIIVEGKIRDNIFPKRFNLNRKANIEKKYKTLSFI